MVPWMANRALHGVLLTALQRKNIAGGSVINNPNVLIRREYRVRNSNREQGRFKFADARLFPNAK